MTTRTRRTSRTDVLSNIANDLRSALLADSGPSWLQCRWAPDVDIVLQRNRTTNRWRLAATCTNGSAPDPDTLTLLTSVFSAPTAAEWQLVGKQVNGATGPRSIMVAETTWLER